MTQELQNKLEQKSAYKRAQEAQLFRAYYLVIADIFNTIGNPEPIQLSTASRLRNQIELIR